MPDPLLITLKTAFAATVVTFFLGIFFRPRSRPTPTVQGLGGRRVDVAANLAADSRRIFFCCWSLASAESSDGCCCS